MMNFKGRIEATYQDSVPAWPDEAVPPAGAPNVVMIVLDDVGFAQLGCYGSDIATPRIDALATRGIRLCNFNTTGICSATRSCLLTGRNHHSNHIGAIAELATGFPGYDFRMPKENGTIAEILTEHGYATFAVGKWHLTPAEEQTLGASRKRWPLGRGFERFYGFHGSDTSHYHPDLVYDNHQVPPPKTPEEGYHLTEDLTDRSIEFIRDLHNASPGKPFFLYLAYGAVHTPLHVAREHCDRYLGRFDLGWDEWRRQVYQRQLAQGVLPAGAGLTPRPDWIPAWDTLTPAETRVYSRLMELFAGFLEHTDEQIGRLVDELERMGTLDNTILVVLSDNGASPEGGRNGMYNNVRYLNGIKDSAEDILAHLESLGDPDSNPHYPFGWAWAGNTPFRRWKQEVHAGGVRDPFVIHWPKGLREAGAIRSQYMHAIDVMPTILDMIGIPLPKAIAGITQSPVHGTSFKVCLDDTDEPSRHITQYYEIRGCRGLYHDGWKVVTYHARIGLAWDDSDPTRPYAEDKWELYHLDEDFSELSDLAPLYPERVARLVELWWAEAGRYDVLPLDNRGVARLGLRKSNVYEIGRRHVLYRSNGTVREFGAMDFKNRAHTITVDLIAPTGIADGVLLSMGNGYGGYALFVDQGRIVYVHNYASKAEHEVVSDESLKPGRVSVCFEFIKSGEHQGVGRLLLDGRLVGEAPIPHTVPHYFGGAEMAVGFNPGYGVSGRYRSKGTFRFNGEIMSVTLDAHDPPSPDRSALERVAYAIQ